MPLHFSLGSRKGLQSIQKSYAMQLIIIQLRFAFVNTNNLQISNIDFVECSLNLINETISEKNLVIVAAIFIVNSTNVAIREVRISKSLGLGMFFRQTRGNVEIYNSTFERNGLNH